MTGDIAMITDALKFTSPNQDLLAHLRRAAAQKLTAAEVRAQEVSFVYGQMGSKSTLTRAEVAELIKRSRGE